MHQSDLPQPILFHPLKHHMGYIRQFIQNNLEAKDSFLRTQLRTVGSSQLDLYLGELSIQQIADEAILYLQKHHTIAPEAYLLYLTKREASYGLISLSDGSKWVLRWGVVEGRHVHLHPARYSQHTIRVKANTLKTAVAVQIAVRRYKQPMSLALINQVRTQWLEMAPIPASLTSGTFDRLVYLLGDNKTS